MPCYPTEPFNLQGTTLAAAFSAPPVLLKMAGENAFIDFPVPYELMGVTLSSSLTNFGTAEMGIFVIVGGNQERLTLGKSTRAIIQAITGTNSFTGPPATPIPSDKVATTVFLQPMLITPNMKIALYAYGDTTAGNVASAVVTLILRQKA